MDWVPRSQRLGNDNFDGPYEGVPPHLRPHIMEWIRLAYYHGGNKEESAQQVALRLKIDIDPRQGMANALMEKLRSASDDVLLNAVEGVLNTRPPEHRHGVADTMKQLLADAGSAHTVIEDRFIVDVTSDQMEAIRSKAVSVQDPASEEITEAWTNAYGRSPDASDAWDHAIKAVETVLQPVVEPNNTKATLSSLIATLNGAPKKWESVFPGVNKDHDVGNLIATLRLMWPNPDRHGPVKRKPTMEEARAVVTLAATLVQWHREGYIVRER